jgi:uncharacterized delta-60 repeat protein
MNKNGFWVWPLVLVVCLGFVIWVLGFWLVGCGNPLPNPSLPAIVSVSPAAGSQGSELSIVVSVTFDLAMDPGSFTGNNFTVSSPEGAVSGTITSESANKTFYFYPASALQLSTIYTARISENVAAFDGTRLGSPYSWSFTTGHYSEVRGITDESFSDGTHKGYGTYQTMKSGVPQSSQGKSMIMDHYGRILVAGSDAASAGNGRAMRIWRILTDGSLDGSFGGKGVVEYFYASSGVDNEFIGRSITLDAAGRILVTGDQYIASSEGLPVWRYNADGTTDESFGIGGKTSYKFVFNGYSIALDAFGNIFVLGYVTGFEGGGLPQGYRIVQFKPDGTFEKTIPADATPEGVVFRDEARTAAPSGKVIVTGSGSFGWYFHDMVTRRFNSDGTTDESFGVSGTVAFTNPTVGEDVLGKSVSIDIFGRVVVMGGILSSGSFLSSGTEAMTVWRYK